MGGGYRAIGAAKIIWEFLSRYVALVIAGWRLVAGMRGIDGHSYHRSEIMKRFQGPNVSGHEEGSRRQD